MTTDELPSKAEALAEKIKHTSHVDGLGMGWREVEDMLHTLANEVRRLREEVANFDRGVDAHKAELRDVRRARVVAEERELAVKQTLQDERQAREQAETALERYDNAWTLLCVDEHCKCCPDIRRALEEPCEDTES